MSNHTKEEKLAFLEGFAAATDMFMDDKETEVAINFKTLLAMGWKVNDEFAAGLGKNQLAWCEDIQEAIPGLGNLEAVRTIVDKFDKAKQAGNN